MSFRERFFGSGLISNIGANGLGLSVQLLIQLGSVPILAHSWGLERYGVWLVMLAVPGYLAVADLGYQGAAANDMTASVAKGERGMARSVFQSVVLATLGVMAVLALGIVMLAFGPLSGVLDFAQQAASGQAAWLVIAMAGYGLLTVVSNLAHAVLRATGAYSRFMYVNSLGILAENAAVLAIALSGGGLVPAAMAFVGLRAIVATILSVMAARRAPWIATGRWRISFAQLRRLMGPAFALAVMMLAFAVSLQTMAPIIAAAGAVALVPIYTAVRTLTRFGVQLTTVVSTGLMPNFTAAHATDEEDRTADLVALTLVASIGLLVPAAIGLLVLGPWFMKLWTGGAIVAPYGLIAALAAAMLFNGIWTPLSNLMLAINRQSLFTYAFLLGALVMLSLAYVLVQALGVTGAGIASMLLEAFMLVWVLMQVRRLGFVRAGMWRQAPQRVLGMVRRTLAR